MAYFYRYIAEKIKDRFRHNQIIILVGARQVGKTNIVKNYFENYLPKVAKKIYFDFEKTVDLELWQNLDYLQNFLKQQNLSLEEEIYLAVDEFQYLKNATKTFKLIFDHYPRVKILATGSSSLEIQKHLKESLAGRKKVYFVYPLSFEEYAKAIGSRIDLAKMNYANISPARAEQLNEILLYDYLLWGGYPRLTDRLKVSREEKKEELRDIFSSYVQKDIKALIGGENISAFNNLVKALASQIGNLLNINELCQTVNLNRYEIEKYLTILEETFIIKRLPSFFRNKRKEISKMPKIYFSDLGLANMIVGNFESLASKSNAGAILENFVYSQLRHFVGVGDELLFWRTTSGAEVDFVWQKGGQLIPIEVKWANFNEDNIPVNLFNFCEKFESVKNAWIITKNYSAVREKNGIKFEFIPAVALIGRLSGMEKV